MDSARRALARASRSPSPSDDPSPFASAPSVAAHKIARFSGAPLAGKKKSKFELAREQEAEKAKREAEDAAEAYKAFVDEFGGEEETGPSNGLRTRIIGGGGGGGRMPHKGFVKAGGGEKYNPLAERPPPPPAPYAAQSFAPAITTGPRGAGGAPGGFKPMAPRQPTRPVASSLMGDDDEADSLLKTSVVAAGKKKREGDNFLEQLKREQAAREDRLRLTAGRTGASITALAAREHAPTLTGSFSTSHDPLTTNVHVGGLPMTTTEKMLGQLFAQFGPVGSVKIMYPRLDGPSASLSLGPGGRKLGGFVAFLRRPDAEKAAKEMDGKEWNGSELKTGWGKAVPIPVRAAFEPAPDSAYARALERTRAPSSRSYAHPHPPPRSRSRSPSPSSSIRRGDRFVTPDDPVAFLSSKRPRSRSPSPSRASAAARPWPTLEEGVEQIFLETVARKVRDNGNRFEEVLRERERDNVRFAFLKDEALPSYHYFRMLIDPDHEPPKVASFDDEGSASLYSSDSSEASEDEKLGKGKLGHLAEKRFKCLLRGLTSSRERIARGMAFALEHADCADYIADLLISSLLLPATPVPRKLARLHLVSDILHNAAASLPNAWVYRGIFEKKLPMAFEHLGDVYLSFKGRLKAEGFRGGVEKVIDVWGNDWMLFEPAVIDDFKRRLAGLEIVPSGSSSPSTHNTQYTYDDDTTAAAMDVEPSPPAAAVAEGGFKSAFKAAAFAPAVVEADDAAADDLDGEEAYDDGLDGAVVAMDDIDGAPAEEGDVNVDGEAVSMPFEDDVDGVAAEVDVDGEAAEVDGDGTPIPLAEEGKKAEPETLVIEDEDDGEAMEMGSDEDDIFA